MIREIKFRAWDTIENAMVVPDKIMNPVFSEGPDEIHCFILMQFTGLKDKTGKEIYEGDIIQRTDGLPLVGINPPNEIRLPSKSQSQKVVFDEGSFKLRKSNDGKRYHLNSLTIRLGGFEIIGNIYKNPELLDTKKAQLSELKLN